MFYQPDSYLVSISYFPFPISFYPFDSENTCSGYRKKTIFICTLNFIPLYLHTISKGASF